MTEQGDASTAAAAAKASGDDANSTTTKKKQRWFPLESNPDLLNEYVNKLGFDTGIFSFVDVFSTEEWALEMIPQPVAAVVMLYPLTETQLKHEKEAKDQGTAQQGDGGVSQSSSSCWFIKQRIGNACGTIGLLHSVMNAPEPAVFRPDSWLSNFASSCPANLDSVAKAEMLESDDAIATLHDEATSSSSNQTSRGNLEDKVLTHFVALVHRDGRLYEMDGRKSGPVSHGPTSPATLLRDACRVVREFMQRDPSEMRFTILALAPKVN